MRWDICMRIFVDKTKIIVAIVSSIVLFLISGGSYGDDIELKTLKIGYKQELVVELKPNIPLVFTPPNKESYLFKLNEIEFSNKTKKAVELDLSVDNFSYMNVSKDLDYIRNKYTSDREKVYALWNYIKEVVYTAHPQPGQFCQTDPQLFLFSQGVALCGNLAFLYSNLLGDLGIKNRAVSSSFSTGHVMNEVYFDGKWRFFDLYNRLYFMDENWNAVSSERLFKKIENYTDVMKSPVMKSFITGILSQKKSYFAEKRFNRKYIRKYTHLNKPFYVSSKESISFKNETVGNIRDAFVAVSMKRDLPFLGLLNDKNNVSGLMNRDVFERIRLLKEIENRTLSENTLIMKINYDLVLSNINISHKFEENSLHITIENLEKKINFIKVLLAKDQDFLYRYQCDGCLEQIQQYKMNSIKIPLVNFVKGRYFYKVIVKTEDDYLYESEPMSYELNEDDILSSIREKSSISLSSDNFKIEEPESYDYQTGNYKKGEMADIDVNELSIEGYFYPDSFDWVNFILNIRPSSGIRIAVSANNNGQLCLTIGTTYGKKMPVNILFRP